MNLEIKVEKGAVDILPSKNDKLHYTFDKALFTVSKDVSENGDVKLNIKASKKNNWKTKEIMKVYVPVQKFNELTINNTGILEINKIKTNYTIYNDGGIQMNVPNGFGDKVTYTGEEGSFFEVTLGKKVTDYKCDVVSNKADFISLPYTNSDPSKFPDKYSKVVGNGSSKWNFTINKEATFVMENED